MAAWIPTKPKYASQTAIAASSRTDPNEATPRPGAARLAREGQRHHLNPFLIPPPRQQTTRSFPTRQGNGPQLKPNTEPPAQCGNRATSPTSKLASQSWQAPAHSANHRDMNLSTPSTMQTRRRNTCSETKVAGDMGGGVDATNSTSNDRVERHVHDLIRSEGERSKIHVGDRDRGGASCPNR